MRRAIIPMLLAVILAALAASPAAADRPDQPETRTVLDFEFEVGPVYNPCTDQETMVLITIEYRVHALPSIQSFWEGDFTHMNSNVTGQAVGHDGYATSGDTLKQQPSTRTATITSMPRPRI